MPTPTSVTELSGLSAVSGGRSTIALAPRGAGSRLGAVVQEALGVDDVMISQAERLAKNS